MQEKSDTGRMPVFRLYWGETEGETPGLLPPKKFRLTISDKRKVL
jgi:hypothetical protein